MKVFLVILIFGAEAIRVGPLPMNQQQCVGRLPTALEPFEDAWKSGRTFEADGRTITKDDVSAKCVIQ